MMKEKIKNIINLSRAFILENRKNLSLINKENNKINKRSFIFWVYVILAFAILYISNEVISYIVKLGKPEIVLNGFLLFLQILIIIRTVMVSINIFYFSKDIENILHLPFKPSDILISKFITVLYMNYQVELLFGLIPLVVYGIATYMGIFYFLNIIITLIIFPIFSVLIVSTIIMILMKSIKFFKNKDLMQIIISAIIIFFIMFFAGKALGYILNNAESIYEKQDEILNNINNKLIEVNKYFVSINPAVGSLQERNILKILFNYFKLICINLIGFLIFIFLGNKIYLKQLLKANFYFKDKKNKKIKLNKKIHKNNYMISYIKKEFKTLIKNPLFFIQSVYPVILNTITFGALILVLVPRARETLRMEEYREFAENLKFNIEIVCIIIGTIQFVGLFNYTSVTAFSREGKNASIIKILPISLYKQFIYKNIPQISVNTICSIVLLGILKLKVPEIELQYIFAIFILSFLMILINSFILSILDLLMPKLEWDAEYEILKNNKNKLLQYFLIILNILLLIYFNNFFEKRNLTLSLISIGIFLILIFIIINIYLYKNEKKLFKNIK